MTDSARVFAPGRRGILWMLLATVLLVSSDTIIKHLVRTYPALEVLWARFLFHLLLMTAVFWRRLPVIVKSHRWDLQMVRGLSLAVSNGLFILGLRFIGLAEASAILFVSPLLVTVFSAPLLGEAVGVRRWIGVVAGFAGALIIIRPGTGMMHAGALLVLAGAVFSAANQMTTRALARYDIPLTTLFYTAVFGTAASSLFAPFGWVMPDTEGWLLMAAIGFLAGSGQFALIKAYQQSEAAAVAPFFYANLLWATGYGFLIFGDLPDIWTISGAVLIVASGLWVFRGEQTRPAASAPKTQG
ncbi:MAG: DMT family transporter [Rhodospirillales bacterium]|nr:DMT family transporter [Rhodospirillales bacterium]